MLNVKTFLLEFLISLNSHFPTIYSIVHGSKYIKNIVFSFFFYSVGFNRWTCMLFDTNNLTHYHIHWCILGKWSIWRIRRKMLLIIVINMTNIKGQYHFSEITCLLWYPYVIEDLAYLMYWEDVLYYWSF